MYLAGTNYQRPSHAGPRPLPPPQPGASRSLLLGAGRHTSQLSSLQITEIFYKIGLQWNWKLGFQQRDVLLGSLPNFNEASLI